MFGLLAAGASLLQGKLNADQQKANVDKTIAANKELSEYQYSKDLEMWNRGNVYNDPMHQMERLKKAGLNPNLVYGSGSAAGMSAGQLPKYNAPTVDYNYKSPVDLPQTLGAFQDYQLRAAQVRNISTEADFKEGTLPSRMEIVEENRRMAGQKRDILATESGTKNELQGPYIKFQKSAWEAEARKIGLENEKLISATKNLNLQNEYFAAKAITGLFGGAVGAAGKLGSMFVKRGAKGALSTGTLRNFKANPSTRHQWRGNYIDNFGYDN